MYHRLMMRVWLAIFDVVAFFEWTRLAYYTMGKASYHYHLGMGCKLGDRWL